MKVNISFAILAVGFVQAASADLIPIGPVPSSGAGLGAVNTALTFTSPANSTTESGCVGAGVGGSLVLGSAACPAGFTGGNEQAINNTYSAASLGLTDFNNLQIIFNGNEPQNQGAQGLTVDSLALTFWDPATGMLLSSKSTTAPYVIADVFPGIGNAGFGFMLDSTQAAQANLLLAQNPNLFLGIASNASDATGGPETVSFRVEAGVSQTPEPATFGLAALALTSVWLIRRRQS